MKRLIVFLLVLLGLHSCTSFKRNHFSLRGIANQESAFKFEIYNYDDNKTTIDQLYHLVDDHNEKIISQFDSYYSSKNRLAAYELRVNETELDENVFVELNAYVDNGRHVIEVRVDPGHKEISKGSLKELDEMIKYILTSSSFNTPLAFFETLYNASRDHLESQRILLEVKKKVISRAFSESEELVEAIDEEIAEIDTALTAQRKEVIKAEKVRREIIDGLDKAAKSKQLKDLLQANDRAGVSDLVRTYLPFEYMTPMEKDYWNFILEKIKNPAPLKDRVLMYRGTSEDRLYPRVIDGKEISKEAAVSSGELAQMSTIISKNQGTWNRRLRSLQTTYTKPFSNLEFGNDVDTAKSTRITTWMKRHSENPQGSMFLSYTPSFSVAKRFGFNSMGAYLIDPSMLLFNQMSGFESEMEYLHALFNFPDEMVAYFDKSVNPDIDPKVHFDSQLNKILKKKYGEEIGQKAFLEILDRTDDFNDKNKAFLIPNLKEVTQERRVPIAKGSWSYYWRRLLGKPTDFKIKKVKVNQKDEIGKLNNCLYLLNTFR